MEKHAATAYHCPDSRIDNPWQLNHLPDTAPQWQHNAWKAFTVIDALRDEIKANSPTHEPEDLSTDVLQADQAMGVIQRHLLTMTRGRAPDNETVELQDAALDTLIKMARTPDSGLARLRMVEPELGTPAERLERARRLLPRPQ